MANAPFVSNEADVLREVTAFLGSLSVFRCRL
jgi:hypothetical protein